MRTYMDEAARRKKRAKNIVPAKKPFRRKHRWLVAICGSIALAAIAFVSLAEGRHILRTREHTRLIKQIASECPDETAVLQKLGEPYAIFTPEQLASFLAPIAKLPDRIAERAMIYQREDFIYIFYISGRRQVIAWQLIRS